jgi:hypothetical protein
MLSVSVEILILINGQLLNPERDSIHPEGGRMREGIPFPQIMAKVQEC